MKINNQTRVYIAGCGGMLGSSVYSHFSKQCVVTATDIDVNENWLSYGDVRDYSEIRKHILDVKPHVIINLAAMTDLEQCEIQRDNTWLTNALGAENLGLVANELHVPYVFISTAGIFDGEQEYYTDFDEPNPLAYYAKSKAYAERWVCQSVSQHYVFRAGWMMGGGPKKDKKFINKIYKQLLNGVTTLHVVSDKLGTPTYTVDFARGIQTLLESDQYGLYNQVCNGSGSRLDVAREFVHLLDLQDKITLIEVNSDFFASEYSAPRPPSEKLVNLKLNARNLNVMRDWRVCLSEYAPQFKI